MRAASENWISALAGLSEGCAENAMLFASAIISGLGLGSMYGLLALGFHVTYALSRTVNFAQGSTMMLGAGATLKPGSASNKPYKLVKPGFGNGSAA